MLRIPCSSALAAFASTAASMVHAATLSLSPAAATEVQLIAGESLTATIQAGNISAAGSEVAVWQLGVEVAPDADAIGSVTIDHFLLPFEHLFAGVASLGLMLAFGSNIGGSSAVFSDAVQISSPPGIIASGENAGLVSVTLSASEGAHGVFRFLISEVDGSPLDSYWIDASDLSQKWFSNATPESDISQRTLLTITVLRVPEPLSSVLTWVALTGGLLTLSRRQSIRPDFRAMRTRSFAL